MQHDLAAKVKKNAVMIGFDFATMAQCQGAPSREQRNTMQGEEHAPWLATAALATYVIISLTAGKC